MRVLQLIDSLNPGGAERMAVSLANALHFSLERSFLCATREEGILKNQILPSVSYLFLEKKSTLDIKALRKLLNYVKTNDIGIIHAHSSSFFLATLLRIFLPNLILIWHDHYGNSEILSTRKGNVLKICSYFFSGIISVNVLLKKWALRHLNCRKVYYIPNFVTEEKVTTDCELENPSSVKIICIANLRPQKDHINLLKAFKIIQQKHQNVSLHLVGKIIDSAYSEKVNSFIKGDKINNVYIYGPQEGVINILKQADIGVLSSISEGLPVSLLEYGLAKVAVVATEVGECQKVIGNLGKTAAPENPISLAQALIYYIENPLVRKTDAQAFHKHIKMYYSQEAVLPQLITLYKN